MAQALAVDWQEVKTLALAIGVREAARQMGLTEDSVRLSDCRLLPDPLLSTLATPQQQPHKTMNQQLTERIQQAIASTPEGKPRLKALKAIQWRLKSPAGYATFSGVGEASEALVFSGCDNETLKARYFQALTGHTFAIELL